MAIDEDTLLRVLENVEKAEGGGDYVRTRDWPEVEAMKLIDLWAAKPILTHEGRSRLAQLRSKIVG